MSRELGADLAIDYHEQDPVAAIMEATDGRGVDVAIEALGTQSTFENCLRVLRPGGVLSSLGVYSGKLTLPMDAFAAGLGDFHALHPVSAKVRDGIDELRDDLLQLLPEGPPLFPREQATDLTLEERIAEVIREKALHLTRDEVPHALTVDVEEVGETVRALIHVETESQKGILIGKKGAMIREIGTRARPEVEALVGRKVFLELVVKVRPRWRRDRKTLERLGL